MVSGAYDPESVAREIDRKGTGLTSIRYPWAWFFREALQLHLAFLRRELSLPVSDGDLERMGLSDYGARLSWPFYRETLRRSFGEAFDYEAYRRLVRSVDHVARVRAPLLAIHSRDDDWMGHRHAQELAARAAGNTRVAVEFVNGAGHATYWVHDPAWMRDVFDRYYSYWLDPAAASAHHAYRDAPLAPMASGQGGRP